MSIFFRFFFCLFFIRCLSFYGIFNMLLITAAIIDYSASFVLRFIVCWTKLWSKQKMKFIVFFNFFFCSFSSLNSQLGRCQWFEMNETSECGKTSTREEKLNLCLLASIPQNTKNIYRLDCVYFVSRRRMWK